MADSTGCGEGTSGLEDRHALESALIDAVRRTALHYGLWFKEAEYQVGLDAAIELERQTWETLFPIAMQRLARVLGVELDSRGLPVNLAALSEQDLREIAKALSVNWLAMDGVWFQSVEEHFGMHTAKRANDTCWSRFSPIEASHIKEALGLPDSGGLDALEVALAHRLVSRINEASVERPDDRTLVYRLHRCRVQDARKRKGMDDYPCKSGGITEYTTFARTIDPHITTECIACPPDEHPADWYCAWRFTRS